MCNRRLDRAAVRHADDILAGVRSVDALDTGHRPVRQIVEALAARRALMRGGEPVAGNRRRARSEERRTIHALPLAEILFGECLVLMHLVGLRQTRRPDRGSSLMRALQIAGKPDSIPRQEFRYTREHDAVAAIAADIGLAVDIAAVLAHRRVPHPPPACRCHAHRHGMLRNERLGRSARHQIGLPAYGIDAVRPPSTGNACPLT